MQDSLEKAQVEEGIRVEADTVEDQKTLRAIEELLIGKGRLAKEFFEEIGKELRLE